jgi:uncharacterized protein (DUF2141 family)
MRLYLCFVLLAAAGYAADVKVVVGQVKKDGGRVHVGLYAEPRGFPDSAKALRAEVVDTHADSAIAEFHDVPPGKYAIAVFQDSNGNGVLDKGMMGRPKEPYGFSNNAAGKFGPPSFNAAAFTVGEAPVVLKIDVR